VLLLLAETAFAQGGKALASLLRISRYCRASESRREGQQTVKVIVQYNRFRKRPKKAGAGSGWPPDHRLHSVKGIAPDHSGQFAACLEADPEVLSVSVDHPMKGLDDISDVATGVPSAWNAGYNGAGIGVAVIDSGINDSQSRFTRFHRV